MSNHLDILTIHNPATGQTMTATRKVYESIYRDKGFDLATRENVRNAVKSNAKGRVNGEVKPRETASIQTGGAAQIAAHLGLADAPEGDAGSGVGTDDSEKTDGQTTEDEDTANANGSVISDERQSAGRSRGRNS